MAEREVLSLPGAVLEIDPAHAWLQGTYDRTAQKYRAQDDEHISGHDYQHVARILRDVSAAFDHPIRVLDLGCGTGRYFHCVSNAFEIIGLDLSEQMLDAAKNPVRADEVTAGKITLIQGDLFSRDFPEAHFDFIYCVGVFGNGCSVSQPTCERLRRWLTRTGILFFDTLDISAMPQQFRYRKQLVSHLYSLLPKSGKRLWVKRSGWPPFFGMRVSTLRECLQNAGFAVEWLMSRRSQLPAGLGYKLEVLCRKQES